jgi:hypothetical protein
MISSMEVSLELMPNMFNGVEIGRRGRVKK